MISSVNAAQVSISPVRTQSGQGVSAPVSSVVKAAPAESVNVFTDYSLGAQVTEVLNSATGIVIRQLPSSSALYALQNEVKSDAQTLRPAAVSEAPQQAEQQGDAFEQFFGVLAENRQVSYDVQQKAQVQYATAIQASLQVGQSNTQLLSELI